MHNWNVNLNFEKKNYKDKRLKKETKDYDENWIYTEDNILSIKANRSYEIHIQISKMNACMSFKLMNYRNLTHESYFKSALKYSRSNLVNKQGDLQWKIAKKR